MSEFINNIVELAKATWNLFCMMPYTCIILAIGLVVTCIVTYYFIKDIIMPDNGGPLILR